MSKKLVVGVMGCLLVIGLLTPGVLAVGKKPVSEMVLGISINTLRHPYYVQIVDGYKKAAKKLGVEIILNDPDQNVTAQVAACEDFILKGVDAILVSPCRPGSLAPIAEEAKKKGIPLLTDASHVEGETCFVASDNYVGGRMSGLFAGEWLSEHVSGRRVKVAILESTRYPIPNLRIPGFVEGLRERCPDAEIYMRDTEANKADAMAKMEDILVEVGRVDVTFGINGPTSLGALAACEAKYGAKDTCCCGLDLDPDEIATLKSPDHPQYMCSASQFPYWISEMLIRLGIRAAWGEKIPVRVWAPYKLATRETVDEVLAYSPPIPEYARINGK